MDEAAAQAKAREYFRTRCTEVTAQAIRDGVRDACTALDAFLETVPAPAAARRPAPGAWSAQEVVDHLIETYRPGLDELLCVLAGENPPARPFPPFHRIRRCCVPVAWMATRLRTLPADVAWALTVLRRSARRAPRS